MREIFRRLFRRASIDDQIREEIESHIAMRAEKNVEAGMSEDDARRAARIQFGNSGSIRETVYRDSGFGWMEAACRDLMYALRGLRRDLTVSITAVITIAVGVGALTSMFSVMRNLFLAPPPHVAEPDRVFRLHQAFPPLEAGGSTTPQARTSYPFYEMLAARAQSLDSVATYAERTLAVGSGQDAGLTSAVLVSAGFWKTLGVRPALGRFIEDAEADPATGARVVVLGHAYWQKRFGGRPGAIGESLRIKGQRYEIIGVAPRGFRGVELADVDVWLPLFASEDGSGRRVTWHRFATSFNVRIVMRVKAALTVQQAEADVTSLQRAFLEEAYRTAFKTDPSKLDRYRQAQALLGPVKGGIGDDLQPIAEARVTAWLVGVAVVLVAIACANVAGLLLLRALRRRREIAVRLALGVSRGRLLRQLLTESAVLALAGGTAAALTVAWAGAWLQRAILPAMSWEPAALLDPTVLGVSAACTLAAMAAAGMAPLWYSRANVLASLHDGRRSGLGKRPRMQAVLLVVQGALSVVLLIGAGLFLRSLHQLQTLDIGLDRDNVLGVAIDFSGTGRSQADVAAFFDRALERVVAVPGITSASLATSIPLRSARGASVLLPGQSKVLTMPSGGVPYANDVTPAFFQTTGMRILAGRGFVESDRNGPPVIVVNETMAGLGWPGRSPVGECVYRNRSDKTCTTVVGVVADARRFNIVDEAAHPYFFNVLDPVESEGRSLLVRVAPGMRRVDSALRAALQELDAGLPYARIETLGDVLNPQMRPWRLGASIFTLFGILAMSLATIGLWSSVSYAVSQRQHEFAVRLAIGARPQTLLRLMLGEGLRHSVSAVVIGLVISGVAARFIASLLFRVSPHDPLVFALTASAVIAVATFASLLPAWQASRIHPAEALRAE